MGNHKPAFLWPFIPLLVVKIIVRDVSRRPHDPVYAFIPLLVVKIIVLPLPISLILRKISCPVREPLFVERFLGHGKGIL